MKEIILTQEKVALVDDWWYDRLKYAQWYAVRIHNTWYAMSGKVYMHRFIMSPASNMVIDHKDYNGLNNQEYNLRICTRSQNMQNQNNKKIQGVFWQESRKKYLVQIEVSKHVHHLGRFTSLQEAALAYNDAAMKYFGVNARLNSTEEMP